ncbi:MAG: glycoside hydrolase, partial [Gemmatimonadota bacterium]
LVDGPVYRSIYENLIGISLHEHDEYGLLNTGSIVYHDDLGDYSTDEPILDGTANLLYVLAAMAEGGGYGKVPQH